LNLEEVDPLHNLSSSGVIHSLTVLMDNRDVREEHGADV